MWRTKNGNRVLKRKEAVLFAESLLSLLDEFILCDYDDYPLNIATFDTLTWRQKISLLSIVANGLIRTDVPVIPLTAALEAAIAAVLEHLKILIIIEIDSLQPQIYWRKIVVAARKEANGENVPPPECNDIRKWKNELTYISEGILWDGIKPMKLYIDYPPEKAHALKEKMNLPEEYFQQIPEDPKDINIYGILVKLRKLCISVLKGCPTGK